METTSRIRLASSHGDIAALAAGQGEPLLLLHGVGLRAEAWAPQMAALAATHRVIALDLPGHGESAPLPGRPALPDYVAWAAAAIQALGCGPVNLAGHSMGALIAAGLAIEQPRLVRRLAVLNGVYRRGAEARAAVLARAAEIAAGGGDDTAPLARWFGEGHAEARRLAAGWLSGVDRAGYAAAYRAFAEGDAIYADGWSGLSCPVLVLTGEQDLNSSPAMARAMAAAAPRATLAVVAGERHMVGLTAPEPVTAALRDWLRQPETAATPRRATR